MNEEQVLILKEVVEKLLPLYTLVTQEEYETLKRDSRVLEALRAGGVDNWEWYDASLEDHLK